MGFFDSTTSTKPKMFGPAKDLSKDILKDAKKDYNSGQTYAYTGSLVTPFSDQTRSALGGLTTLAGNNSGTNGMGGNLQDIINRGGFTGDQTATMDRMKGLENSDFLNNMISGNGLTADQNLVADRYRTGMGESFDLASNPAYAAVRERALKEQQMALDANAAKSGRFGGGASQSILAREQGALGANMDVTEYDKWRARTDKAASDLAGLSQTGVGNTSAAIGQRSGLQNSLFNAQASGLDRMAQAYQAAQQPYLTQRAVGAEYEDLMTRQLADQKRIHDELDPLNRQREYLSLATGTPAGSTQTSSPSLAQILTGGGLGVLALGGMNWGGAGGSTGVGGGV